MSTSNDDPVIAYLTTRLPNFDITLLSEKGKFTTYGVGCFTLEQVAHGVSRKFTVSFGGVIARRDLYHLLDVATYISNHISPRGDIVPNLRIAARSGKNPTPLKSLIAMTPYTHVDVGIALTVVGADISMISSDISNADSVFVPDNVYSSTGRWVHSIRFGPTPKRQFRTPAVSYAGQ